MVDSSMKFVLGCGVAAGLLITLHFTTGRDTPPQQKQERVAAKSSSQKLEEGLARDQAKWEEWKSKFQVDVGDSRQERDEKGLAITMQAFRAQPVEIVDRPDSQGKGGIQILDATDIERVIAEGGSYTGPVPSEIESKSGGQK